MGPSSNPESISSFPSQMPDSVLVAASEICVCTVVNPTLLRSWWSRRGTSDAGPSLAQQQCGGGGGEPARDAAPLAH